MTRTNPTVVFFFSIFAGLFFIGLGGVFLWIVAVEYRQHLDALKRDWVTKGQVIRFEFRVDPIQKVPDYFAHPVVAYRTKDGKERIATVENATSPTELRRGSEILIAVDRENEKKARRVDSWFATLFTSFFTSCGLTAIFIGLIVLFRRYSLLPPVLLLITGFGGVCFVYAALSNFSSYQDLYRNGIRTTATINAFYLYRVSLEDSFYKCYPHVSFIDSRGEEIKATLLQNMGETPCPAVKSQIPVIYPSDGPELAQIDSLFEAYVGPLLFLLAGIVMIGIGWGLPVFFRSPLFRPKTVLQEKAKERKIFL